MYAEYYGLNSMPFQLTPDSRFFFGSAEHKRAMAFLDYGISQAEGFVVVTGEVGAGKTTLVDHLLSTLDPARYITGRIVTTQLNSYDTLRMVGVAFNIFHEGMDKATLVARIAQMIGELHLQNKRALLIVDEAQSLTKEAIEELRMLSNLVVAGAPPLQTILLGQPEFRAILSGPGLEQMRQRVTASCHLGALTAEDTRKYVEHRLDRVGWKSDPSFSNEAFGEIYRATGGVPRRINTLCSRILLLGFLEERHHIDQGMVQGVASELLAELGPLQGSYVPTEGATRQPEASNPPEKQFEDLVPRIAKIESRMDQHEKLFIRALDAAVKHLPALKTVQ